MNPIWAEIQAWGGNSAVPTQVMANMFVDFDALAKHSPVNGEKYVAMLALLIEEFQYMFSRLLNAHGFLDIFATLFLVDINYQII